MENDVQNINANQLDNLKFTGTVVDGELKVNGLLNSQELLDSIQVAIYAIDINGTLILYNKTAVVAWGRTPLLNGTEKYCGAHILRYPDGEIMPHELAPPRVTLRHGATIRNINVICEQPDGTWLKAIANIFPIHDVETNKVIGAVNIIGLA